MQSRIGTRFFAAIDCFVGDKRLFAGLIVFCSVGCCNKIQPKKDGPRLLNTYHLNIGIHPHHHIISGAHEDMVGHVTHNQGCSQGHSN